MKSQYSATQVVHERVSVRHDALLEMMIEYLTDMVSGATHISDDGKLIRTEDQGRHSTWYVDVPIRDATEEDRAIMAVLPFLRRKHKR